VKIAMSPIPYDFRDLEPSLSRQALQCHFYRQQRDFEALTRNTEPGDLGLEDLIVLTAGARSKRSLFHYASSVWNHHMFWHSMRPDGGGAPYGPIGEAIENSYGTYDNFGKAFVGEATRRYGSGWIWLIEYDGNVRIVTTENSNSPLLIGQPVLLAFDLWEHAYFLDYQSRRIEYVQTFLDELINWEFANDNLAALNDCNKGSLPLKSN
jgi:superoxide dismutase, Fe-Mn family